MECYAEQYKLQSARGTSGESSICVATLAGSFLGDRLMRMTDEERKRANVISALRYQKTEKGRISRRNFRQTDKYKAICQSYRIRYPNHWKAKNAVANAVRQNKIPCIKTRRCYFCFEQAQQYHHYKGYEPEFWLDVIPVCVKCHIRIRRKKGVA